MLDHKNLRMDDDTKAIITTFRMQSCTKKVKAKKLPHGFSMDFLASATLFMYVPLYNDFCCDMGQKFNLNSVKSCNKGFIIL